MNESGNQARVLELLPGHRAGQLAEDDAAWLDQQLAASPQARAALALHGALASQLDSELRSTSVDHARQRVAALIASARQGAEAGEPVNLLELLPAYAAGGLSETERRRMDMEVARSSQAAQALNQHRALTEAMQQELAQTSVEDSRSTLMFMIRNSPSAAASKGAVTPSPKPSTQQGPARSILQHLADWLGALAPQRLAPVLLLVVAVTGGLLVQQHSELSALKNEMRGSAGFVSTKTARVRFLPSATAEQVTKALVSSGAHIVGGPDQFGDYWVASSLLSRQEMKDALVASGVLNAPPADDDKGPPSQ